MTPQQKKADELVGRFLEYANPYEKDKSGFGLLKYTTDEMILNATKCAIICVEEIMKAEPSYPCPEGYYELHSDRTDEAKSIWQSVLNELKSRL